jgi:hypothetical protein
LPYLPSLRNKIEKETTRKINLKKRERERERARETERERERERGMIAHHSENFPTSFELLETVFNLKFHTVPF